jgi:uncharacterized protein YndB with AHSA1/START domain
MSFKTTTISQTATVPANTLFEAYLNPKDNIQWNYASDGWTTGKVDIDARVGGKFAIEYISPDRSRDFVVSGVYDEIVPNQKIVYSLDDGRPVTVQFIEKDKNATEITIELTLEDESSEEMQRAGWGMIMKHFVDYVERKNNPNNNVIRKSILIKASPEKVWKNLLDKQDYEYWTEVFTPGSTYEGEMKLNNTIIFTSPESPAGEGMKAKIKTLIPNFQISFEHLGSQEASSWSGFRETYTIWPQEESLVRLDIYCDTTKEYFEMMDTSWDKALDRVKELGESSE